MGVRKKCSAPNGDPVSVCFLYGTMIPTGAKVFKCSFSYCHWFAVTVDRIFMSHSLKYVHLENKSFL